MTTAIAAIRKKGGKCGHARLAARPNSFDWGSKLGFCSCGFKVSHHHASNLLFPFLLSSNQFERRPPSHTYNSFRWLAISCTFSSYYIIALFNCSILSGRSSAFVTAPITAIQSEPACLFIFAASMVLIPPIVTKGIEGGIKDLHLDKMSRPCGSNPTFLLDVAKMGPRLM